MDESLSVPDPHGPPNPTRIQSNCPPRPFAFVAPPKWKMMIVTGMAIYPLTLFLPDLLAVHSWPMPKWLGHLAMMAVMMPLATYVAIPAISSVFRRWLTSAH